MRREAGRLWPPVLATLMQVCLCQPATAVRGIVLGKTIRDGIKASCLSNLTRYWHLQTSPRLHSGSTGAQGPCTLLHRLVYIHADLLMSLVLVEGCRQQVCPASWGLLSLMCLQATEKPFINALFDKEPLERFTWGRVVLLGEAAHPTTPHGLRRWVACSRCCCNIVRCEC